MNDRTAPGYRPRHGHGYLLIVTAASGLFMVAAGVWALTAPQSFAGLAGFPPFNEHFVHDLGAFQLGIGVTLLLALFWRDALALALAGFLVGNSAHAVNHFVDLHLGGHGKRDWISLTVLSLAVAAALVFRLRELGYVVGEVRGRRRGRPRTVRGAEDGAAHDLPQGRHAGQRAGQHRRRR
jgi:hypothetical protein